MFNREERIGVFSVAKIFVEDFKWIFREQSLNDFGIDAFVEVTQTLNPYQNKTFPTGRIFAIQIKSGISFFKELNSNSYIYRGSRKHLNYWLNFSVSVVLIIYDKSSNSAYWQEICESTITRTVTGFKVCIPRTNYLNIQSKERLNKISYFKDDYQYKLSVLRNSIDIINAVIIKKHFLYVELSSCNWTKDFQVSLSICEDEMEFAFEAFYSENSYSYFFYLPKNKCLVEGIKDILPWVDLEYNGLPFSNDIFCKNVREDTIEFAKAFGIPADFLSSESIYEIACQMIGDYNFRLEIQSNELALNFLNLNNYLSTESKVEQRFFI
ncbi:hypothetical protein A5893_00895 [Pedobacter psychrophilus]|uniref:DUF4365 domain-containing protein n=1 Tax=Pedobacter psychrophilus TaxID=1826909 RepID=A0A179DLU8_9SPHI|nr:DUF4365 domain-containing protein [Pedobacter psychrophilus]OAQ41700.1 hypothetical protein A5893_00895 [Pedobacter psychrophilus]